MISKYESLYNYLKLIQSKHNISICINDFTGFIPLDKDLDLVMQNFMIHSNDYCMLVKTEGNFMESCLNMKKGILLKCLKTRKPFYGVCHAGVGEFIYPIFHEDKLLGVLNVGIFKNNNSINNYFLGKVCRGSKLPINKVSSTFNSNMKDILSEVEKNELDTMINFACEYLAATYGKLSLSYHTEDLLKKKYNSSEDFILAHSLQFIQSNYRNDVDVNALKDFCHCSASYINHIFKKRTGNNIKYYINNLRIVEAKELLTKSEKTVSEISSLIGFKDPDYFSRVFSNMVGIPPRKYRERFY